MPAPTDIKPPMPADAAGIHRAQFISATSRGPAAPTTRLHAEEDDLEYFDMDHRYAHGLASSPPLPGRRGRRRLSLSGVPSIPPSGMNPPSRVNLPTSSLENLPSVPFGRHNRTVSSTSVASSTSNAPSTTAFGDRKRRGSHDDLSSNRRFLINVSDTQRRILEQEDTNGDSQITVEDLGPKAFTIGTANSGGLKKFEVRGTYAISNLLQELALAADHNRRVIVIDERRLNENPVDRLHRVIKYHFWDGLTRRIDADGLEAICNDPKNRQENQMNRIYIPFHDEFAFNYYNQVSKERAHLNLEVVRLPEIIDPEYVKSLHKLPGILSLALRRFTDPVTGLETVRGAPFVVPGGRFNEMYGWDSYFETLGLLADGRVSLAHGMVDNFVYEIEHYGKILNANRSYYLTRSQPPFLTDMIKRVFDALRPKEVPTPKAEAQDLGLGVVFPRSSSSPNVPGHMSRVPSSARMPQKTVVKRLPVSANDLRIWLARSVRAALKELLSVWLSPERLDSHAGLTKYRPDCVGVPPETESGHFDHLLEKFASKYSLGVREFEEKYQKREILEPELDEYFLHDGAVRESGHDTTYRFDNCCADLATIDLNCLVYRYETDLEELITNEFGGSFKFRVRRGPNDIYLNGFRSWLALLLRRGIDGTIGNHGGWDATWARGIMVFDSDADTEHQSATDNTFSFPTLSLPSAHSTTFTVVLPASLFSSLAERCKNLIDQHLWSEEEHLYLDYNCKLQRAMPFQTVTALWALWAGVASKEQADKLIKRAIPLFEVKGGLVSGTEASRGKLSYDRPMRQWDYPFGWAPHQIMAWEGLRKYRGTDSVDRAGRLAYRWLFTLVQAFVDFNGVVPEKFDVVGMTHRVNVEYGNVGTDFKFVVREGFGWMNASFQIGLTYLSHHMRRALGTLTPPDQLFAALDQSIKNRAAAAAALAAAEAAAISAAAHLPRPPMVPAPTGEVYLPISVPVPESIVMPHTNEELLSNILPDLPPSFTNHVVDPAIGMLVHTGEGDELAATPPAEKVATPLIGLDEETISVDSDDDFEDEEEDEISDAEAHDAEDEDAADDDGGLVIAPKRTRKKSTIKPSLIPLFHTVMEAQHALEVATSSMHQAVFERRSSVAASANGNDMDPAFSDEEAGAEDYEGGDEAIVRAGRELQAANDGMRVAAAMSEALESKQMETMVKEKRRMKKKKRRSEKVRTKIAEAVVVEKQVEASASPLFEKPEDETLMVSIVGPMPGL
ncbi:alpha,alpha-trehalase nth1 [Irineochytrium annulatum]|nr:alpha,alpha-trehalase nth1 [Irineochytrium annulatum]